MDARDDKRRLSDSEVERLLAGARPEPARLSEEASRALFARALEQSGVAAPKRAWWSFGAPRWALAAATCVFAFAVARVAWEPGATPSEPAVDPPAVVVVTPAVKPPVAAVAPVRPAVARVSSAAPARPSARRIARASRHNASVAGTAHVRPAGTDAVEPTAPPMPAPEARETLASLLIVTAENSPAELTVSEAPPETEGFARVAAYDDSSEGSPVVHECVVTRDDNGDMSTEYARTAPEPSEQGPYLKVEPAPAPAG